MIAPLSRHETFRQLANLSHLEVVRVWLTYQGVVSQWGTAGRSPCFPAGLPALALQRLFWQLQYCEDAQKTKELTRAFGWAAEDAWRQRAGRSGHQAIRQLTSW